jgi:hypothetical protein
MDTGTLILIGAGCALLCVVLFVLGMALQVIGTVFQLLGGLLEIAGEVFNFGPVPGCGCVLVLMVLGLCGGLALMLSNLSATCGTVNQIMICRLFGY